MPFPGRNHPQPYLPLAKSDADAALEEENKPGNISDKRCCQVIAKSINILLLVIVLATCIAIAFTIFSGLLSHDTRYTTALGAASSSRCKNLDYRREWRSLNLSEKAEYIRAVKCLAATPSITTTTSDLYNDFPFIHSANADQIHYTAFFLPWHRYLLHVFEAKLRSICHYNGTLAYWDWSLDWETLAASPVFDNETGFGGDGSQLHQAPIGNGRCVTDGPFADLQLFLYSTTPQQHCLSRSFFGDNKQGWLSGKGLQPGVIEDVLSQPTYEAFRDKLEHGPHKEIPNGIRGDFETFTAPNDPIFWLHHSQLDRLWWLWQRADPVTRLYDFGGVFGPSSNRGAQLNDFLPSLGILAPDKRVSDVMSTESDLLCYRYH